MKTIALIHGWNHLNYTKYGHSDVWHNRIGFVNQLSNNYNVLRFNLPGFCGEPEPKTTWDLSDFASFLEDKLKEIKPDYVLGYSFGAAVALKWKIQYPSATKLILVSPAICRAYKKQSPLQRLFQLKKLVPRFISNIIRDFYLKRIQNPFYINGTKFLKETYLNIVKIDISNELSQINSNDVLIIFGSEDTATPPRILLSKVNSAIQNRVKIIQGGGHDIANSNTMELINIINTE